MATITPGQAGNFVEDMYVLHPILISPIPYYSTILRPGYRLQAEHIADIGKWLFPCAILNKIDKQKKSFFS